MAEVINRRRNIFVNSEEYHQSNGDVNLLLPALDFNVNQNEMMRIALESFVMPKTWYNVNAYNNIFYIRTTGTPDTYQALTIPAGNYSTTTITTAIKTAFTDVSAGFSALDVSRNDANGILTLDFSAVAAPLWTNASDDIVCFQVPPARQGLGVSVDVSGNGFYSDSFAILGGKPIKYINETTKVALQKVGTSRVGFFPMQLQTMKAIHMVTNLQTHSYQTPHMDVNSQNTTLVPSNIFAKIPVYLQETSSFAPITYQDSGANTYSVDLQNKNINSIVISLTDDKGRPLPQNANQAEFGLLSYLATFKWLAISTPEVGKPLGFLNNYRQMNLLREN